MNNPEAARRWTSFLASRKEISRAERLLEHFNAGTITRVCNCGCNSYNLAVPTDSHLEPLLAPKGRGGCVLSIAFHMRDRPGSIELDVFADANGYLAGVDVACNANSEPVPANPELLDAPYHVRGALMR